MRCHVSAICLRLLQILQLTRCSCYLRLPGARPVVSVAGARPGVQAAAVRSWAQVLLQPAGAGRVRCGAQLSACCQALSGVFVAWPLFLQGRRKVCLSKTHSYIRTRNHGIISHLAVSPSPILSEINENVKKKKKRNIDVSETSIGCLLHTPTGAGARRRACADRASASAQPAAPHRPRCDGVWFLLLAIHVTIQYYTRNFVFS